MSTFSRLSPDSVGGHSLEAVGEDPDPFAMRLWSLGWVGDMSS